MRFSNELLFVAWKKQSEDRRAWTNVYLSIVASEECQRRLFMCELATQIMHLPTSQAAN